MIDNPKTWSRAEKEFAAMVDVMIRGGKVSIDFMRSYVETKIPKEPTRAIPAVTKTTRVRRAKKGTDE